jgi:predicted transcriptional regulator
VDHRTRTLLLALDDVAVSLLLQLLAGDATEAELADRVDATQSTVNRRLQRLATAGVIAQTAGKKKAPGRPWRVVHPEEVDTMLTAVLDLSERIDESEAAKRSGMKNQIRKGRQHRRNLKSA